MESGGGNVALNGNTTRKKSTHAAGDIVKFTKELIKLHKEVFMTSDILFVNGIPFFILLGRNITFTVLIHIKYKKEISIFKSFKEIYIYDLKRGF